MTNVLYKMKTDMLSTPVEGGWLCEGKKGGGTGILLFAARIPCVKRVCCIHLRQIGVFL